MMTMSTAAAAEEAQPSVAIIGGGISGLSCALHLQKRQQVQVTVFDTGRLLPGGRCSSRFSQTSSIAKSNQKNISKQHTSKNKDSILSRYTIDHAAQMLVLPQSVASSGSDFGEFEKQVLEWEKEHILCRFPKNSVVEIVSNHKNGKQKYYSNNHGNNKSSNANSTNHGHNKSQNNHNNPTSSTPDDIQIRPLDSSKMFYATQGMGSIPLAMKHTNEIHVEQDVWISPSNGVKFVGTPVSCPKWSVQTNGKRFGVFDQIIVAHNGKCADRLMSRTPAKDLHSLLRVDFRSNVPEWGGKKMTLNSIYSLTVALQFSELNDEQNMLLSSVVGKDVMVAFVKNEPNLRMITNQSKKFAHLKEQQTQQQQQQCKTTSQGKKKKMEVWTILSSASFAKKYKAPQENLPEETVEQVTTLMLASLEKSLGLKEGTLHKGVVKDSRLQLWGAAVPLNVWAPIDNNHNGKEGDSESTTGFLYDAEHGVGACGDWLLDPSIAGAWESGRRLAEWILDCMDHEKNDLSACSVGLPAQGGFAFQRSRVACNAGIGNVR